MIKLIVQSFVELFLKLFTFLSAKRVAKIRHKPPGYAVDVPELDAEIDKLFDSCPEKSGFYVLENNIDAFTARCSLINQATQSLDLQYYYFHADTSGKIIAQALVKAADRGVRVRILLDDIDTLGADEAMRYLNAHPSIEIRIFNPFYFRGLLRFLEFIVDMSRVGRRMHNKVMLADNAQAIVGGRNISDVYFSADPDLLFLDIDLLAIGRIVKSVSISFDDYWNSRWAVPVAVLYTRPKTAYALNRIKDFLQKHEYEIKQTDYLESIQESKYTKDKALLKFPYVFSEAELFYDHPGKADPDKLLYAHKNTSQIKNKLHNLLGMAKSELNLISPYFVPGADGVKRFAALIEQGVTVNIYTNSLAATDVTAVHAGYAIYRKALLKIGVNIFELKATAYVTNRKHFKILRPGSRTSLHTKTVIIDQQKIFMGSPNLDPRSIEWNTEIGLFIDNELLTKQFLDIFSSMSLGQNSYQLKLESRGAAGKEEIIWQCEEEGELKRYTSEPDAGLLRKLKVYIFSLLPIENLL